MKQAFGLEPLRVSKQQAASSSHACGRMTHEPCGQVLIDVRNYCESCIGNFNPATPAHPAPPPRPSGKERVKGKGRAEGQAKPGPEAEGGGGGCVAGACAELIDPKMRQSTDFPDWLARPETR